MNYVITIDNFEGPLDLLLHLIKQTNINIYEIQIEKITFQYLEYIKQMEDLNLNIASEYLSMAAELIEIKSNSLLPKPEVIDEEEDPKEVLIKKLVDYQNYKSLTSDFKKLENLRNEYYTKKPSEVVDYQFESKVSEDIDLDDLVSAFQKFLLRAKIKEPLNTTVTNKEYSITERSIEIRNLMKNKKEVSFNELFDNVSKAYIIITFLSVLSLAKNKEIIIKQSENFDDIILSGVVE